MHYCVISNRLSMKLLICALVAGLATLLFASSCSKNSRPSSANLLSAGNASSYGTTGGEFVLNVIDTETGSREAVNGDYTLTVTENAGQAFAIITAECDSSSPDRYLELLYDPAVYTPNVVQAGEIIEPKRNLFLAVTTLPGIIPIGIAAIGEERSSGRILPAGAVVATAAFTREPYADRRASSKGAMASVAGILSKLLATLNDDGILVTWRGTHPGDYDLDGEVSIVDLTPLAMYFGEEPRVGADGYPVVIGDNEYVAHIDTSGNGAVDIADVTAIAVNFGSVITGYRLYLGKPDEEENPVWETGFVPNSENPDAPFTLPFSTSREPGQFQNYSFQLSLEDIGEDPSLWVRVTPTDGNSEGSPQEVQVFRTVPHDPFPCAVCHNEEDMSFKGVESTCLYCHPKPPEDKQQQWNVTPTLHNTCLGCHKAHEFRVIPPNAICADCHPDLASESVGTGMEACLDCHNGPHLPTAQPEASLCSTCHPGTAEQIAAAKDLDCYGCHESHKWKADQTICSTCHTDEGTQSAGSEMPFCGWCHADHDFALTSAQASCVSCHSEEQQKVADSSMPTCGMCHQPHLWAADVGICADCHSSQADEVSQSSMTGCNWCHSNHDFTPETASIRCQFCHAEQQSKIMGTDMPSCGLCHASHLWAADSGACQDCHPTESTEVSQSEMPDCSWCHRDHSFSKVLAEAWCTECHPNPPEAPSTSWDSAPSGHRECASCHEAHTFGLSGIDLDTFCGTCHAELVDPSQAAGMGSCVSCHESQHIPKTDFTASDCGSCHSAVFNLLVGTPKENCMSCHLPHAWSGDPDACASCHAEPSNELAGSGMADCSLCHENHNFGTGGLFNKCTTCHPRPLPALHEYKRHKIAECEDCHSAHGFSEIGRAPCVSCHKNRSNHNPGVSCQECHDFTD